jgi:hypothetical protein
MLACFCAKMSESFATFFTQIPLCFPVYPATICENSIVNKTMFFGF